MHNKAMKRPGLLIGMAICAVALAVVIAGCSPQGGPQPGAQNTASGTGVGSGTAGGEPIVATRIPLPESMPLAPYKPFLDGPVLDLDAEQAALEDAHSRRQASIATCMKEAGFTYEPAPYIYDIRADREDFSLSRLASRLPLPLLSEDRAVVEKWGYGVDPEDYYADPFAPDPEAEAAMRTQQDYVDSLSDAARSAYHIALSGSDYQLGDPGPAPETSGGCAGAAEQQIPKQRGDNAFRQEFYQFTFRVADVTLKDVAAHPSAVAASESWNTCMIAAGVDLGAFMPDPPTADTMYYTLPTPQVADEYARSLAVNAEGLGFLQADPEQVSVALADFDCRAETGYIDTILDVQREMEQDFLDRNRAELDRMRIAAGG
jgi:hypothetical protein